jgi:hypothetical protein
MNEMLDLRQFLNVWPYDPDNNVRLARGADGREIIVVRQPMGLETYEVDGRPDGQRPHGAESAFDFQLARLAAAKRAGAEAAFKLTAADCAELFDEGTIYYHRFAHFFRLKDWARAERDTARNLRLIDFVKQYAEHEEDRVQLDQWRPDIARMNAVARATILLEKGQFAEAFKIARDGIGGISSLGEHLASPRELTGALLQSLEESLAIRPALRPREESVFVRQGDYWTIRYQGQAAILKATRGLYCLGYLLRHPGREIHVSELLATLIEVPALASPGGLREAGGVAVTAGLWDAGPILDAQAKAEYKRRIDELRKDMEEAERFNDSNRAARARGEMDAIAEQLAAAVGLGGRDRRASSKAERARSAVTKRIKEAVNRIADVIPPLGHHLAVRIKTGYFCSYNPHPDRPVAWKF